MSRNLFIYTRKEGETEYKDSFNIDLLIRTVQEKDGQVVVLLNDFHVQSIDVPVRPIKFGKDGKPVLRTEKRELCSEIWLSKEDGERLYQVLGLGMNTTYNVNNHILTGIDREGVEL